MIIKRKYFSSKEKDKKKKRAAIIASAGLTAGTALAIGLAIKKKNKKAAQKAADEAIKKSEAERQRITKETEEYIKSREAQTKKDVDKLNELREDLNEVYQGKKSVEEVKEKVHRLNMDEFIDQKISPLNEKWDKATSTLSDLAESDPEFRKKLGEIL